MRTRIIKTPSGSSLAVRHAAHDPWVGVGPALAAADAAVQSLLAPVRDDLIGFLALGQAGRDAASELIKANPEGTADLDLSPTLPFEAKSLRAFSVYEQHQIQSARGLVRRYLPKVATVADRFESITGRTFPKYRPVEMFHRHPLFYMGNPLNFRTDEAEIPWPSYCSDLDFEIELASVVCRDVAPDTPADKAREAIGGFVLLNDISARDTQWDEYRNGVFGPVVKAKTFANQLASEVITSDEIWPVIDRLQGEVRVNGEVWSRPTTAGAAWTYGDMVAYGAAGEQVHAGEIFSAGTLPNGCGLELDRWLKPGDRLELELEILGTLSGTVGRRGR
jgi:2-keto-4-pentenoate hydratase/2-oxohepta-3-ene-1,7-dioic acid hydratase in catechol pathway